MTDSILIASVSNVNIQLMLEVRKSLWKIGRLIPKQRLMQLLIVNK